MPLAVVAVVVLRYQGPCRVVQPEVRVGPRLGAGTVAVAVHDDQGVVVV